tara:strand:- start:1826 stop:1996 length:171 start_codon:yes stop_codon:yes gene_type:complete
MQVKDIMYSIGEFFWWAFESLVALGNIPNLIFLAIGSVLFLYWMGQMRKHSKAGEK